MTSIVVFVAMLLLFSLVHTGLAHEAVRTRLQQKLRIDARRYRLVYNVIAILLLAVAFRAPRDAFPIVWSTDGWLREALRGVQVAALLGTFVTLRTFDLHSFAGLRGPDSATLTTTGVFRICRHPLYLFSCVFFSAWPTMDLRLLIFAAWVWIYAWIGSIFEERKLVAHFGDAYRDYQLRHARLLPWPWLLPRAVARNDPNR
jgi:protein-S-isoprenylcysteine O-methyltransferase Ste14